jgi:hypothetical protein
VHEAIDCEAIAIDCNVIICKHYRLLEATHT